MIHANVFNLVTNPTKNRRFVNAILNYPAEVRVIGLVTDLEAMAANKRVGGTNATPTEPRSTPGTWRTI